MNLIYDIFEGLIKGLNSSNNKLKSIVKIAIILTIIAIGIVLIGEIQNKVNNKEFFDIIGAILGITAAMLVLGIKVYDDTKQKEKQAEKIENLEKEIKEKPQQTQTAWELARLKLESYLNKNLKQVSAVFYLSSVVMLIGFGLIIFGVFKVYSDPKLLYTSILVSCSGVIVNFIGGIILLIYKSIMNQAKNYVEVLERINAVGMSIQILESINKENLQLKDTTTAEIAKELLKIYGNLQSKRTISNNI